MSMLEFQFSVQIEMDDGVHLSTIIVKPTTGTTFPVVLVRTPYNAKAIFPVAKLVAGQLNFVVILQDTRGRYDSEGTFDIKNEKADSLATINWIKKQPWFNGELHIFGASYMGYIALQLLDEEVDIKTVFAPTILGEINESIHRGKVLQLHWALPWSIMTSTRVQASLELINGKWPEAYNLTYKDSIKDVVKKLGWPDQIWQLFLSGYDSSIWKSYSIKGPTAVKPRYCLIGAWYDFLLNATLSTYEWLNNLDGMKPDLIIGPWSHNGYLASQAGIETWEFGIEGKSNFLKDFSELIKREKTNSPQIIKAFILRANKWVNLDAWPPTKAKEKKFFLMENQQLTESPSEKELYEFTIDVDPNNPVPTIGGLVWEFYEPIEPGPKDQRKLHSRKDILHFYSKALEEEVILLGPISVDLWVKTGIPEAHFTAKLNFIDSEENERIVQDGILQVKGPIKNFQRITIDLLATGILLKQREKIGIEVSWSNYPKYALPRALKPTTLSVAVGKEMPSCLKVSVFDNKQMKRR